MYSDYNYGFYIIKELKVLILVRSDNFIPISKKILLNLIKCIKNLKSMLYGHILVKNCGPPLNIK